MIGPGDPEKRRADAPTSTRQAPSQLLSPTECLPKGGYMYDTSDPNECKIDLIAEARGKGTSATPEDPAGSLSYLLALALPFKSVARLGG